jgi:glycosyltransferase involved in cell wall biosynthesis
MVESKAASRFKNVILRRNISNQGAHNTINSGIALASGEIIAVINSDDVFFPDRIEKLVECMYAQNAGLAFSGVSPIDESGVELTYDVLPSELFGVFDEADAAAVNLPAMSWAFLEGNPAISTGNLLFKRSLFGRLGGFADLKYVHDWDFVLRATLLEHIIYLPDRLYGYRIHGANSFSSLAGLANIETRIVRERFNAMAKRLKSIHRLAPLRRNWPGLPMPQWVEC